MDSFSSSFPCLYYFQLNPNLPLASGCDTSDACIAIFLVTFVFDKAHDFDVWIVFLTCILQLQWSKA